MKRRRTPAPISGTVTTLTVGDRQVFRVAVLAPFLAVYQIGDQPQRRTLWPRKAMRLAKEAAEAAIREARGE
ncbi:hypothetical protein [Pseudarthrobacter siccitolerans]